MPLQYARNRQADDAARVAAYPNLSPEEVLREFQEKW